MAEAPRIRKLGGRALGRLVCSSSFRILFYRLFLHVCIEGHGGRHLGGGGEGNCGVASFVPPGLPHSSLVLEVHGSFACVVCAEIVIDLAKSSWV